LSARWLRRCDANVVGPAHSCALLGVVAWRGAQYDGGVVRLWFTDQMRWRQNRLHLLLVLIVDVLALTTWSLPAVVIGASLTASLVCRIVRWNTRRFASPS
jgi:hypothetical protein